MPLAWATQGDGSRGHQCRGGGGATVVVNLHLVGDQVEGA